MNDVDEVVLAGRGVADSPQLGLIDAKARAVIRYADPAAWITASAVARAVAAAADRLDPYRHEVGVAVASDDATGETMGQVQEASAAGFSSPLRYAAAGPGTLAGVACIAFGFRGPTINLAMPPDEGIPILMLMSQGWLTRGTARAMVLAVFKATGIGLGSARAVLLGSKALLGSGDHFTAAAAWLGHAGD